MHFVANILILTLGILSINTSNEETKNRDIRLSCALQAFKKNYESVVSAYQCNVLFLNTDMKKYRGITTLKKTIAEIYENIDSSLFDLSYANQLSASALIIASNDPEFYIKNIENFNEKADQLAARLIETNSLIKTICLSAILNNKETISELKRTLNRTFLVNAIPRLYNHLKKIESEIEEFANCPPSLIHDYLD
jgi:translation initiation factor 2B subunit (eIF-2B alpha/beta/delta family)